MGSVLHFYVACYISEIEVIVLTVHYGHLVRILHWCTDQAITSALEQMGLTAAQGRILGYVAHHSGPPCPKDIEAAFHLSHPTVSGLLSRLEQKAFLQLRPDPQDRRCKRIYLLEKGITCQEQIGQLIRQHESRIVRGFSPEEQAQFASFLQRAIENLGGSPCPPHPKEESHT